MKPCVWRHQVAGANEQRLPVKPSAALSRDVHAALEIFTRGTMGTRPAIIDFKYGGKYDVTGASTRLDSRVEANE